MKKNSFLFIGFENLNLKDSYSWADYRLKFNPLDYSIIFLNITEDHDKFQQSAKIIRDDIYNAICAGAEIVVVFELAQKEKTTLLGSSYVVSNIDILPIKDLSKCFTYDKGQSKKNIRQEFSRYFKHLKEWHWYLNEKIDFSPWQIFKIESLAENNINKSIGLVVALQETKSNNFGILIILPKINDMMLGIREILEDYYQIKLTTMLPLWINDNKTFNENKILLKRNCIRDKIKIEANKLITVNHDLREEREIKKILYEDGSILEESVKKVFSKLGLTPIKEKITEEDCYIESAYGNFLFEVKGSEKGFGLDGPRQLVDWITNFDSKGYKIDRCIFLVNHFRFRALEEREIPFPDNVIKFAKMNNFLLMTTSDLFNIYNLFLQKKIITKNICKLFKTSPTIFKLKD